MFKFIHLDVNKVNEYQYHSTDFETIVDLNLGENAKTQPGT